MQSSDVIEIDGSIGEGGGQILRSSLTLSLVTGRPCRLTRIRAGRKKPGLLHQHLVAVQAAADVGAATVEGAALGSQDIFFEPTTVRGGTYRFAVGTAGSTTLVLQTILPPLLTADSPSEIALEGGTHNPFAPPFDFLQYVLLPILRRMGARLRAHLVRPGFFPAGGGEFRVTVEPVPRLERIDLLQRGEIVGCRAVARVSKLPDHIAERELATVGSLPSLYPVHLHAERVPNAIGPGNALTLEIEAEGITELFTSFGRLGVPAERVAEEVVDEVRAYLASGAPVGPHLADQLLLPFALAGGGNYRTMRPTRHTLTNIEIVQMFVDVSIRVRQESENVWIVAVDRAPPHASVRT